MNTEEKKTSLPVNFLVVAMLTLMAIIPVTLAVLPVFILNSLWLKALMIGFSPVIFTLSFLFLAAVFSMPFQKAIIPGKFPRDVSHVVYGPRRLYGLCWGAIFYFTPIYYAVMSIPALRTLILRAFGYTGHTSMSIAPDAWIRDLPLLHIDKGAYVANKATIGTNICLANGSILVDKVILKEGAMVGHLSMIGPGTTIGNKAEVGVGGAIGIRVRIGDQVRIAPTVSINHGAQVGNRVVIGAKSYIGMKSIIEDGVKLPAGCNIADGAHIKCQDDVNEYVNSEARVLRSEKERLESILSSRIQDKLHSMGLETLQTVGPNSKR